MRRIILSVIIIIGLITSLAYGATTSVGNNNTGTVNQASTDSSSTATGGGGGSASIGDSYVLHAPDTVAQSGQRASSVYSLFGGVNMAQTEEAKQTGDNIKLLVFMAKNGIISADELRYEVIEQYVQLKDASRPKRLFGVLWRTRGNSLVNGFGMLSMDDLWSKFSKDKDSLNA
ncbi:MAG: hypothetical protein E2O29_01625 [Deltaproteobacteria bacterium]|nr:MAG: hypothetical protein E2O29_01625 [Deltaproteobacteria bacterium]